MIKRIFDAAFGSAALIVSSPLWLVIPIAIKLEDGGPIFFPQDRVGLRGRVFMALKFRSMRPDAEALTGPIQATENDPRVTRVGRLLRVTRGTFSVACMGPVSTSASGRIDRNFSAMNT